MFLGELWMSFGFLPVVGGAGPSEADLFDFGSVYF